MADQTIKDATDLIRARLLKLGKRAVPASHAELDYADVVGRGGGTPYWEAVIRSVTINRTILGQGTTRFTITVEMRLWAVALGEAYDGHAQQLVFWDYLPRCLHVFETRRTLQFPPDDLGGVPLLQDETGSGLQQPTIRVAPGDAGTKWLVLVFPWQFVLDAPIPVRIGDINDGI